MSDSTLSNDPKIFVIGAASNDALHLTNGTTAHTVGGAGLYTALAVNKCGTQAELFAPKPQYPLPEQFSAVDSLLRWSGPEISFEQLPQLEIKHHGGGKATLLNALWGAELQLAPEQLPAPIKNAAIIHIAALSSARRQLDFLQAISNQRLQSKRNRLRISAGTYARLVYGETEQVRKLFELADLFFMNENEATGLFGSVSQAQTRPEALLFVTMDAEGALVIEGAQKTHIPGHPVAEVDPTGAGDTFCGATLAGLAQGLSPVAAAQLAVKLAAQTVNAVGPAALMPG